MNVCSIKHLTRISLLIIAGAWPSSSEIAVSATQGLPSSAAAAVSAGWTATQGIDTPESVYFDAASGSIFTSQIVGAPDGRDGNGRIAKLAGNGSVTTANWVTGLNAPKGMRGFQGTLWVADLDEVVGIDIVSGKVTTRVKIEGAKMLNDVACSDDGTVYVSDTVATRIYSVRNGKASVFAEGEELEYPNGLLVSGGQLVVGGWGKPELDFSTKVPGRLFTLDLRRNRKP